MALSSKVVWTLFIGSQDESIATVGFKHSNHRVNSLGETLGDRSVIHKFVFLNLLLLS